MRARLGPDLFFVILHQGHAVNKPVAFLVLIIAVIALSALLRNGDQSAAPSSNGLPWQIKSLPDGTSEVFGLVLTRSTFGDARARFGPDMEIAVIAAPGEPGALEAYYQNVTLGVFTGKMVLVADVDKETIALLRQRAVKAEYMDGSTRKYILQRDDLAFAWRAPIAGITFIPAVSLDPETVVKRFGAPTERIRVDERVEHFLYPQQGLDLMLDSQGKEVLQYVAPREFARLRAPLLR
jgi:hypothetical protein